MRVLSARYDASALRPPAALATPAQWHSPSGSSGATWQAMRQWCVAKHQGSDRSADWFATARLSGGAKSERSNLVESLCQDLDGSVRLAACGGALSRLWLKLMVKLDDLTGSDVHESRIWDCGYAMPGGPGLVALGRFQPRRDTLIVIEDMTADEITRRIEALHARATGFARRVRVLVMNVAGRVEDSSALGPIILGAMDMPTHPKPSPRACART